MSKVTVKYSESGLEYQIVTWEEICEDDDFWIIIPIKESGLTKINSRTKGLCIPSHSILSIELS